MFHRTLDTPIGRLFLAADDQGVRQLLFRRSRRPPKAAGRPEDDGAPHPVLDDAAAQLHAYFAGTLRRFTVPVTPDGTPFQRQVWQALCEIPYGETTSYGALAARIGNPKAVRAVGLANGSNPISIIIPCHRVIGSNGSLVGYGGGLSIKDALLAHERGQRRLL